MIYVVLWVSGQIVYPLKDLLTRYPIVDQCLRSEQFSLMGWDPSFP